MTDQAISEKLTKIYGIPNPTLDEIEQYKQNNPQELKLSGKVNAWRMFEPEFYRRPPTDTKEAEKYLESCNPIIFTRSKYKEDCKQKSIAAYKLVEEFKIPRKVASRLMKTDNSSFNWFYHSYFRYFGKK